MLSHSGCICLFLLRRLLFCCSTGVDGEPGEMRQRSAGERLETRKERLDAFRGRAGSNRELGSDGCGRVVIEGNRRRYLGAPGNNPVDCGKRTRFQVLENARTGCRCKEPRILANDPYCAKKLPDLDYIRLAGRDRTIGAPTGFEVRNRNLASRVDRQVAPEQAGGRRFNAVCDAFAGPVVLICQFVEVVCAERAFFSNRRKVRLVEPETLWLYPYARSYNRESGEMQQIHLQCLLEVHRLRQPRHAPAGRPQEGETSRHRTPPVRRGAAWRPGQTLGRPAYWRLSLAWRRGALDWPESPAWSRSGGGWPLDRGLRGPEIVAALAHPDRRCCSTHPLNVGKPFGRARMGIPALGCSRERFFHNLILGFAGEVSTPNVHQGRKIPRKPADRPVFRRILPGQVGSELKERKVQNALLKHPCSYDRGFAAVGIVLHVPTELGADPAAGLHQQCQVHAAEIRHLLREVRYRFDPPVPATAHALQPCVPAVALVDNAGKPGLDCLDQEVGPETGALREMAKLVGASPGATVTSRSASPFTTILTLPPVRSVPPRIRIPL